MADKFIFCSNCFRDPGLRITAQRIGSKISSRCVRCNTRDGMKIRESKAESLIVEFFWNGSFFRSDFGGAHRIISNQSRYGDSNVIFPEWLRDDAELIQEALKIGFFHYGPPLWRVGEIEPLIALRDVATRESAARSIVQKYPTTIVDNTYEFYRLRTKVSDGVEMDDEQYDSPPKEYLGKGRLDCADIPVLYGSPNLEICFHECRVALPDEAFLAHLSPRKPLKMLDLRADIEDGGSTEFESLNLAMHFLFCASEYAYPLTRALTRAAKQAGFDGLMYPSFFSLWKPQKVFNIGVFGRPIAEKLVTVRAINRAFLTAASYEYRLGPVFK